MRQSKIYQLYSSPDHEANLFRNGPYEPYLTHPDQTEGYGAMYDLWKSLASDPPAWIGFTTHDQVQRGCNVRLIDDDVPVIEQALKEHDVLGFGFHVFDTLTLSQQAELSQDGFDAVIKQLGIMPPPAWYMDRGSCLYCGYWIMTWSAFDEYMQWLQPLVEQLVATNAPTLTEPRGPNQRTMLADVIERLMIIWAYSKRVLNLGEYIADYWIEKEGMKVQQVAEYGDAPQFDITKYLSPGQKVNEIELDFSTR